MPLVLLVQVVRLLVVIEVWPEQNLCVNLRLALLESAKLLVKNLLERALLLGGPLLDSLNELDKVRVKARIALIPQSKRSANQVEIVLFSGRGAIVTRLLLAHARLADELGHRSHRQQFHDLLFSHFLQLEIFNANG